MKTGVINDLHRMILDLSTCRSVLDSVHARGWIAQDDTLALVSFKRQIRMYLFSQKIC